MRRVLIVLGLGLLLIGAGVNQLWIWYDNHQGRTPHAGKALGLLVAGALMLAWLGHDLRHRPEAYVGRRD
jgi:hypothetical protein